MTVPSDLYAELFEVSKILLAAQDSRETAAVLLRRLVERTGAERGFLVMREGGSYVQKFEIRYDRAELSEHERRFSRTLVRSAIADGELLYLPNLAEDPRFVPSESALLIGPCSVLVCPLRHEGEIAGVVYLEDRRRTDAFSAESRLFLSQFAEVAGLFLSRAAEHESLLRRTQSLERELFSQYDFRGIVTRHPSMLALLEMVAQVAESDAPVLIQGETGTGKELIAQALHVNSARRSRPFVTVHCAALPATLLEAELFGHLAGAYTDAKRDRPGRIKAADGGTLFLDEIGEIPLEVQAKLLRFLQFGEIQRIGADRTDKVDVRVVTATHRDLRKMSREGQFREDLFFRLKVLDLTLPPLRERRSDLPLLAEHFLARFWRRAGETPRWSAKAERALYGYDYPGNIRELAHAVERACLLARGPELDLDLLPEELRQQSATGESVVFARLDGDELNAARDEAVATVEKRFLEALMGRHQGNVSLASRSSGIHRSYLQKLLARHR
jgi:transcriptional regulator with GAF, ATPase, and Fis domain